MELLLLLVVAAIRVDDPRRFTDRWAAQWIYRVLAAELLLRLRMYRAHGLQNGLRHLLLGGIQLIAHLASAQNRLGVEGLYLHLQEVQVDADASQLHSNLVLNEGLLEHVRAIVLFDLVQEAIGLLLDLADVVFEGALCCYGFPDQILLKKMSLSFFQGRDAFFHLAKYNNHILQVLHALEFSEASLELLHALVKLRYPCGLRQTGGSSILQDAHIDGVGRPRSNISNHTLAVSHTALIRHQSLKVPRDVLGLRDSGQRLARVRVDVLRHLTGRP